MPVPLVPIIAGIASIVGSAIAARSQKKQAERTAHANQSLAAYGYSQDKNMWDQQNQYNSPAAQMSRFKEAGLNPNLIYGQGSSGNASQAPSYNTPQVDLRYQPMQIPDMLSMYQDFQTRQAQIDNVKAQTDLTRQAVINRRAELLNLGVRTDTARFDLEQKDMLRPYSVAIHEQQVRQGNQRLRLMSQQYQSGKLSQAKQAQDLATGELNQRLIKQRTANEAAELIFKQQRNYWQSKGINSSDNPLIRILGKMMSETDLIPDRTYLPWEPLMKHDR